MQVMAEIVVLPVVKIERVPAGIAAEFSGAPPAPVTDLNAWRYARERAAAERLERTSLLPCDCGEQ
jgi:hypothetical protein